MSEAGAKLSYEAMPGLRRPATFRVDLAAQGAGAARFQAAISMQSRRESGQAAFACDIKLQYRSVLY